MGAVSKIQDNLSCLKAKETRTKVRFCCHVQVNAVYHLSDIAIMSYLHMSKIYEQKLLNARSLVKKISFCVIIDSVWSIDYCNILLAHLDWRKLVTSGKLLVTGWKIPFQQNWNTAETIWKLGVEVSCIVSAMRKLLYSFSLIPLSFLQRKPDV